MQCLTENCKNPRQLPIGDSRGQWKNSIFLQGNNRRGDVRIRELPSEVDLRSYLSGGGDGSQWSIITGACSLQAPVTVPGWTLWLWGPGPMDASSLLGPLFMVLRSPFHCWFELFQQRPLLVQLHRWDTGLKEIRLRSVEEIGFDCDWAISRGSIYDLWSTPFCCLKTRGCCPPDHRTETSKP